MKTLIKSTLLTILLVTAMSCKKNEPATQDSDITGSDSTETTIDTVGPDSDTTTVSGAGTTGATGEGSTGSGSAGTVQKGSAAIKTDSTSTKKGR
ncbi:hypothetical protein [Flavobacterium aquidurense]|uniref:hypothetical protein n=1 Tax=Flavobacterium aquidurense TaxID=362413 RepID=UPI002855C67A|nr:hypothetical protein [Flavobacterium aquidurense]MDR7372873.1 hypothetical protein [Flavobacterium aquidurense]